MDFRNAPKTFPVFFMWWVISSDLYNLSKYNSQDNKTFQQHKKI